MVLAVVEPLGNGGSVVAAERLAVKIAHKIFRGATAKEATGIDVDNHDPLHAAPVAVDGQLHKVGTLKLVGLGTVALAKLAQVLPVLQVGGGVEAHVLVGRHNHNPLLGGLVPEHLGVAEVLQPVKGGQNGVVLIFGKGAAVVGAVGHALNLAVLVAGRGIEGNDGILAVAGRVVLVHHRAAREDVAHRVARNGRLEVLPVYEVAADGVAPVHVAPLGAVGVVLEVEVILAVLIYQSVGVVHPAVGGGVVVNGAEIVGIGGVEHVTYRQAVPAYGTFVHALDADLGLSLPLGQLKGHVIVNAVGGQTHVHGYVGRTAGGEPDLTLRCRAGVEPDLTLSCRFLNGQEQIFLGMADAEHRERIGLMLQADAGLDRLTGCK
ncbi:unknown [Prevotella sp. CAG:617]|nr:unknown [Prevotella sp. CAG:617]